MQLQFLKKSALLATISLFFFFQNLEAHQLGLTISNLKYSKETLTLSTRIFYADFYQEFLNYSKVKNKNYAEKGIDDKDKKEFTNYFKKHIRIWINNSEIHFNTIALSFERHEEDAYILLVDLNYTADIETGAKIKIKNTVLLNTITGQKHVISVFMKDPKTISHGIITLDKSNPKYEFVNE